MENFATYIVHTVHSTYCTRIGYTMIFLLVFVCVLEWQKVEALASILFNKKVFVLLSLTTTTTKKQF